MQPAQHGVVSVGDSWLSGYGLPLAGMTCVSWASWLAWALDACCTTHAVNGATAEQVARDQIPLLRDRYRIGATWLGVNDLSRYDATSFRASVTATCTALARHCDLVAIATVPAVVRLPNPKWRQVALAREQANGVVREVAAVSGCVLVELEDALAGRWSMAPDREHPTSLGQLEAARRAAAALDGAGLRFARHLPESAALRPTDVECRLYDVGLVARARGAWTAVSQRREDRMVRRVSAAVPNLDRGTAR